MAWEAPVELTTLRSLNGRGRLRELSILRPGLADCSSEALNWYVWKSRNDCSTRARYILSKSHPGMPKKSLCYGTCGELYRNVLDCSKQTTCGRLSKAGILTQYPTVRSNNRRKKESLEAAPGNLSPLVTYGPFCGKGNLCHSSSCSVGWL